MADNKIQIGAELTLDNKQIKTEFTKAGEEAGKSVAQGLEKQQGTIIDKINETVDEIRVKIEALQEIDWNLVDPTKTEQDIKFLETELDTIGYTIENLKYGRQDFGDEGEQAFNDLMETSNEYRDLLYDTMDGLQYMGDEVGEAMNGAEQQTKETTEAVKELNETASQGISENGGLGKMLKFLSSKEIINFFYKNLKKIGQKLIELSGDAEMLSNKFQPVVDKLEGVGGYIGKGLTPAVEGVIDDLNVMTDELIGAGEAGQSSAAVLQKGVFIVGQAIRGLIKLIRSFGIFFGSVFGGLRPIVSGFFTDLYDTAKSVIQGIGDVENRKALGNNIKYGIVQGVNGAIESVNGVLNWINDKLGINLGNISKFEAGAKSEYNFKDISFNNTKNAVQAFTQTMNAGIEEVGREWADFINDTKEGRNNLGTGAINTNRKIKDNTKKTLSGGQDSVKGAYEEMEEEAQDIRDDMDDLVDEHQKKYDKLTEQIDKLGDEYDKLRDEAKKTWEDAEKALKSYTDELEKAQSEAITDLGQRYVELRKELMGVGEYMKKVANELSRQEIQIYQDWGQDEYRGYKLKELIELKEKLDEMQLIEENTTEEQRKSTEFLKETSKAQEILNKLKEQEAEIEEKKAAALEKQAIAQSVMNQENGKKNIQTLTKDGEDIGTWYYNVMEEKREQIHDVENVEYAKQLENQTTNLNDQLKQFQAEKNEEVEILTDLTARKIQLENEYDKVFEEAIKKQKQSVDELIQKRQRLIDKKNEYYGSSGGSSRAYGGSLLEGQVSLVGENGPEQIIARQSSYVQPRNASNSYSTVNTNNLNINGLELGNFNTVDDMLEALKEKLTYRA